MKMIFKKDLVKLKILIIYSILLITGCSEYKLPSKTYSQYQIGKSFTFKKNTLKINLKNPLECPIRIYISSSDENLQTKFNQLGPILLQNRKDTTFTFTQISHFNGKLSFSSLLGSLNKKISPVAIEFPFNKNKAYSIIQGNNTNYSHNTSYSRYALDFSLKTNDTVYSATSGYIVGIINKYKFAGVGKKWEPFANFITIYEPESGIFYQYVHLKENGSLVQIGDKVKVRQKIGLSGNTGNSGGEHLHFNCLIPVDGSDGLKSIPITFINGQKSVNFKKGDKINR